MNAVKEGKERQGSVAPTFRSALFAFGNAGRVQSRNRVSSEW